MKIISTFIITCFLFQTLVKPQGIPTKGEFNCLLVFVNASDSSEFNFEKKLLADEIVKFYKEMSFGSLSLKIEIFDYDLSNAPSFTNYKEANNFILEEVDKTIDFEEYSNYKDSTIIDGLFIIYDNFYEDWSYNPIWSGIAGIVLDNYDHHYDGKKIFNKIEGDKSSGIILRAPNGFEYTFWVAVHEIGHLLGLDHFPEMKQNPYLQLMNPVGEYWGVNRGMAFWEKEELGWITPDVRLNLFDYSFEDDSISFNLDDYMSTGHYSEIILPKSEYHHGFDVRNLNAKSFYFENRANISKYDQDHSMGIYVWYGKGNLVHTYSMDSQDLPAFDTLADGEYQFNYEFNRITNFQAEEGYDLTTYSLPININFYKNNTVKFLYGNVKTVQSKYVRLSKLFPGRAVLLDNFPNPFNPTTTINFDLYIYSNVDLTVYDLMGSKIETIYSGKLLPGNYSFNFNADNYASGIYIYRLNLETFEISQGAKSVFHTFQKKMIHLK